MESLTLEQAYYIGELITAVAFIVSLSYVGIQIRQNTHTIKLNSAQNVSHEIREAISLVAADGELANIHLKAMQDIDSLSPVEKHRIYMWFNNLFRVYENAHYQNNQGAADEVVWNGMIANLVATKKMSGYQEFWHERKFFFSKEFQDFYDSELGGDENLVDAYQEKA